VRRRAHASPRRRPPASALSPWTFGNQDRPVGHGRGSTPVPGGSKGSLGLGPLRFRRASTAITTAIATTIIAIRPRALRMLCGTAPAGGGILSGYLLVMLPSLFACFAKLDFAGSAPLLPEVQHRQHDHDRCKLNAARVFRARRDRFGRRAASAAGDLCVVARAEFAIGSKPTHRRGSPRGDEAAHHDAPMIAGLSPPHRFGAIRPPRSRGR
jgi:hypothetical protein